MIAIIFFILVITLGALEPGYSYLTNLAVALRHASIQGQLLEIMAFKPIVMEESYGKPGSVPKS